MENNENPVIIDFVYESGKTIKGEVVALEEGIGFTLVDANDKDHYLACFDFRPCAFYSNTFMRSFYNEVLKVINGSKVFNARDFYNYIRNNSGTLFIEAPSETNCVFGK